MEQYIIKTVTLILLVLMLFENGKVRAQGVKDFDADKSSDIDKNELLAFLAHHYGTPLKTIDSNKDGLVSSNEWNNRFFVDLSDIKSSLKHDFPYSFAEIDKIYEKASKRNFFNILIRSDYENITIHDSPKRSSKAEPAVISYSRNFEDTTSIWTAQGAVMRNFKIVKNDGFKLSIIPSVYFNRKISSNGEGDLNTLISRIGPNLEIVNNTYFINVRINYALTTDFDFDTDINALELDIEPGLPDIGMGLNKNILGLGINWRVYFHLENGENKDVGDNENIILEHFTRVGFKGEIGIKISNRWSMKSKYGRLWSEQEPKRSELLNLKSSLNLDDSGIFSFNIEYMKGNIPFTQENADNLLVGLGIKM